MKLSSTATTLVRQADDSLLGVAISNSYTFDEQEAEYLQALADAGGKRPEEIIDALLYIDTDGEPGLVGYNLLDDLVSLNTHTMSAMVMSTALAMFLDNPNPVDPPPFHDPQPRKGRMLAGELPYDEESWERAADRWREHLNGGYGDGVKDRAIKTFNKALKAALKLDGKTCREQVIAAAQEAGYMCDCCERLIRQGLRYDGIYTCCHECAWCQSLEHSPCCHGMCNQPTVTQLNTLTAAMLEQLIQHAVQESLDVYQLIAAMAMTVEYDEVTSEQRNKTKRELFAGIHKLQVRLERSRSDDDF